jgi:hydrogenase expression/formation protein HypC
MCLGIPGRITEIQPDGLMPMGKVDFGGAIREVCLAYVPEAGVGDYVVVHVGFAISKIDEEEARQSFELMKEAGILDPEWGNALFPESEAAGS